MERYVISLELWVSWSSLLACSGATTHQGGQGQSAVPMCPPPSAAFPTCKLQFLQFRGTTELAAPFFRCSGVAHADRPLLCAWVQSCVLALGPAWGPVWLLVVVRASRQRAQTAACPSCCFRSFPSFLLPKRRVSGSTPPPKRETELEQEAAYPRSAYTRLPLCSSVR